MECGREKTNHDSKERIADFIYSIYNFLLNENVWKRSQESDKYVHEEVYLRPRPCYEGRYVKSDLDTGAGDHQ